MSKIIGVTVGTPYNPENIQGGGVTQEELEEAVKTALAEAKESGEFDGFSPTVSTTKINGEAHISIKDKSGSHYFVLYDGKTPVMGTDYFTEADKQEFVDAVLNALPVAEGANF